MARRTFKSLLEQLKDVPGTVQTLEYDPATGAFKATFWTGSVSAPGPAPVMPGQTQELNSEPNALDLVLVPPQGVDDAPYEAEPAQDDQEPAEGH